MKPSLQLIVVFLLVPSAFAKVDFGERSWSWTKGRRDYEFKAVLLRASQSNVILGSEDSDGNQRLKSFKLKEFSDSDILYVQEWRLKHTAGIEKFRAAKRETAVKKRISLYRESEALGNPRAAHYIGTSLALRGDYDSAIDLFQKARAYYRARVKFLPSMAHAYAAAQNNYALGKFRAGYAKPALKAFSGLADMAPGKYLNGVRHNLEVYKYLSSKNHAATDKILGELPLGEIQETLVSASKPRKGWLYMKDDRDAASDGDFDRMCMGCKGKGYVKCRAKHCKNGLITYFITKTKRFRNGTTTYKVPKTKDCPVCKGGRVQCRTCDGCRETQHGGRVDERFRGTPIPNIGFGTSRR